MGKKYLLYIHDERFQKEPQKSSLINLLLSRHYDYYQPGTLVEDLEEHEDLDGSVVGSVELASDLKAMKQERCLGHDHFRRYCGKPGCAY